VRTAEDKKYFTTGEVALALGVAVWQARRAIDALGAEIPRAGLYRLVPVELLGQVREQLAKMGYSRPAEAAHAS
jgi:hypothetical protein